MYLTHERLNSGEQNRLLETKTLSLSAHVAEPSHVEYDAMGEKVQSASVLRGENGVRAVQDASTWMGSARFVNPHLFPISNSGFYNAISIDVFHARKPSG